MNRKYILCLLIVLMILGQALVSNAVKYEYDALNRLVRVTYDNGATINYQYDKGGNITKITSSTSYLEVTRLPGIPPLRINIKVHTSSQGNLLYKFLGKSNGEWETIREFDSSAECIWLPARTHDDHYSIQVMIKDSDTGRIIELLTKEITRNDLDILVFDFLNMDTTNRGEIEKGKPVEITAKASGADSIQYNYIVKKENDVLYESGYTPSGNMMWQPESRGEHTLIAKVKAGREGDIQMLEKMLSFVVIDPSYTYPALTNLDYSVGLDGSIAANAGEIFREGLGSEFKFSAAEHMYKTLYSTDYSTESVFDWIPGKSGVYRITASIRDIGSKTDDDSFIKSVRVERGSGDPVRLDSVDYDVEGRVHPVNTEINFTAQASGGNGEYLYAFWRQDARGHRLIQDYSPQNTFTWCPANPGVYDILVRVKDTLSGSYEDQKSFSFTITTPATKDIQIDELTVAGSEKKGTIHTIKADANGSDNLLYKFIVTDNNGNYTVIQDFSNNNTCTWIPKHARSYSITVWVKDAISGSYEKTKNVHVTIK